MICRQVCPGQQSLRVQQHAAQYTCNGGWCLCVFLLRLCMGCRRAMGKPCMPCDAWVRWSFPELRREGNAIVEAISRRQRGLFGSTRNPVGGCRLHCPRCCQRGVCGEPRRPRKSGGGPASGLSSFGRAKLLLSRASVRPVDRPARQEPRPPEGVGGSAGASPSRGCCRLGGSLALPRGLAARQEPRPPEGVGGSAGASLSRGGEPRTRGFGCLCNWCVAWFKDFLTPRTSFYVAADFPLILLRLHGGRGMIVWRCIGGFCECENH